ncbi:hypothetical protein B0H19DRAFT_1271921 [Mycena capillaripes]|nr:hypothetical protein B0H19DRAFT_1271921 [Mycena capillaripes]
MSFSLATILILLVVSSWLNVAFYTLELMLAVRYFTRPSRPLAHKVAVGILLGFDGVCTLAISVDVCLAVVRTSTKNFRAVLAPLSVAIITTYVSAVVTQLFLCNLFYILTRNKFSRRNLVRGHRCHHCRVAVLEILVDVGAEPREFDEESPPTSVDSHCQLRSHLRGNTLLMMILLLKGSPVFDFFFTCQGRVYALTILGNFLVGIPSSNRDETTPSQRFWRSTHSSAVMFHIPGTPNPKDNANGSKSTSDRLRSTTSGSAPHNQPHESLHLADLALGSRHSESDLEEEGRRKASLDETVDPGM